MADLPRHPARTISVALFACPHCIDEFAFDYQRIRNLAYRLACPRSLSRLWNVVEVVMLAYTLIHNSDPTKYQMGGDS